KDAVHSSDDVAEGEDLAASVGKDRNLFGKDPAQRLDVAFRASLMESSHEIRRALRRQCIARPRFAYVAAGARCELANRRRLAFEDRGYLVQRCLEDVVKQECSALQR